MNVNLKKIVILIGFVCLCFPAQSQQNIEPSMVEIPAQNVIYKSNGQNKNLDVSSFYISKYPESNKQYQEYLTHLDSIELVNALPKRKLLKTAKLKEDQIDFLINEFYNSKIFYKYPIIGLSTNQIQNYLEWKSDHFGKLALNEVGIEYDSTLSYIELVKKLPNKSKIPIQTAFLLPIESIFTSAYSCSNSVNEKRKYSKRNQDLRGLEIEDLNSYELGVKSKLEELIYTEEGNQTIQLKRRLNKKLIVNIETLNILKPFRVWHIKTNAYP